MAERPGESNNGEAQNKNLKVSKKTAAGSLTLPEKDFTDSTLVMALPSVNCEGAMIQNQSNSSEITVKKKSASVKKASHQSPMRVSNGEVVAEEKGDKLKAGVLPTERQSSKSKDRNEYSGTSNQMLNKKSVGSGEDMGQSAQQGEKIRIGEQSKQTMVSTLINFSYPTHIFILQLKILKTSLLCLLNTIEFQHLYTKEKYCYILLHIN